MPSHRQKRSSAFPVAARRANLKLTSGELRRTKLIDDAKLAKPKYRGLVHGTIGICRDEGIGGIYRGLFPTVSGPGSRSVRAAADSSSDAQIMRQGANSAVRFGSYSTLKKLVQDYTGSTAANLSAAATFGVGGCAGIITVCGFLFRMGIYVLDVDSVFYSSDATMPLDNVKTRMRSSLPPRHNLTSSADWIILYSQHPVPNSSNCHTHRESGCPDRVPQLVPLRVPDCDGGGRTRVLARGDSPARPSHCEHDFYKWVTSTRGLLTAPCGTA